MTRPALRIRVQGRVQGVGFRWWVTTQARALDLQGWVRNRSDGSVEALVMGGGRAIAKLVESCHRGPTGALVRSVETEPAEDDGSQGFEQKATV
ncbi:MAG: acylphosphatase [Pseudomonadota bacterium]